MKTGLRAQADGPIRRAERRLRVILRGSQESLPGANRSVMPPLRYAPSPSCPLGEAIGSGGGRWVAEVTAQGAQGDADERHEPQR